VTTFNAHIKDIKEKLSYGYRSLGKVPIVAAKKET
jgi:hypothetical protein